MASASRAASRVLASPSASPLWKVYIARRTFMSTTKEKLKNMSTTKEKLKKEWGDLDLRSKLGVVEVLGKYIMLGVSGSWGVTLAKDVFDRVAKNEDAVKKLSEDVNQMNVEMAHSEEMFRKHKEEVAVNYEKLRHEVNELRCFKDLWMAHGYTSSVVCDATVPLPGTQEAS